MELAGLSCAQALAKTYPTSSHPRVLVVCGPGNQGGDGLVAARHLHMFRYKPTLYIPKPGGKVIYKNLLKQCENLKIPVLGSVDDFEKSFSDNDVVMDAVFGQSTSLKRECGRLNKLTVTTGFSFAPPVRKPFDRILRLLESTKLPIISVDIPSGWSVTDGPQPLYTEPDEDGKSEKIETFTPDTLISLTAPKQGVRDFKGKHYLGGRFVPE